MDYAIFYEGPYVKENGMLSKQIVIGKLNTRSRTLVTEIARQLSREGRRGKVVTGYVQDKNFMVRAQSGRIVKLPPIVRAIQRERAKARRKTSRKR